MDEIVEIVPKDDQYPYNVSFSYFHKIPKSTVCPFMICC